MTVLGMQRRPKAANAVTSDTRLAQAPDVSTFAEMGSPAISWYTWYGLFVLKGTSVVFPITHLCQIFGFAAVGCLSARAGDAVARCDADARGRAGSVLRHP
jgi:Tripartite tricarboxylate transporter family receptor